MSDGLPTRARALADDPRFHPGRWSADMAEVVHALADLCDTYREALERYREALYYYADADGELIWATEDVLQDAGARARGALGMGEEGTA